MTTWASFASRYAGALVILPLVLAKLTTAEIAVWLLFRTIVVFQGVGDMGFTPTFARVIAFAMGGTRDLRAVDGTDTPKGGTGTPEWSTVGAICRTMRTVYFWIALGAVFLLATGVTWAFLKPMSELRDPTSGWLAWAVVVISSGVVLRGNTYSAYLQGINEIPLLRRWEALTNLGGVASSLAVLLLGGGLLPLILAEQIWRILGVVRNYFLCRRVRSGRYFSFEGRKVDQKVFGAVWPSAWRSGLGIFMSLGLIESTGFLYAQVSAPEALATYLLALRLMRILSQFAQAPFYSKLPLLARLLAEGRRERQVDVARRSMQLSYWSFTVPFVLGGLFGEPLLSLIRSNAAFPGPVLWGLLGLAFFIERYGAMHLQLYSTTNRIIWHVANGVSGAVFYIASLALLPVVGVYAFPLGLLLGYAGFYAWYSALHSYRAFGLRFLGFDGPTVIPLAAILAYLTITFAV